jgi:hypothetical protein
LFRSRQELFGYGTADRNGVVLVDIVEIEWAWCRRRSRGSFQDLPLAIDLGDSALRGADRLRRIGDVAGR